MDGPGQVVSYQDDLGKLLPASLSLVDQCSLCKITEMNLQKAQTHKLLSVMSFLILSRSFSAVFTFFKKSSSFSEDLIASASPGPAQHFH